MLRQYNQLLIKQLKKEAPDLAKKYEDPKVMKKFNQTHEKIMGLVRKVSNFSDSLYTYKDVQIAANKSHRAFNKKMAYFFNKKFYTQEFKDLYSVSMIYEPTAPGHRA